tara:strand:+ start:8007 stop:8450 length:444 start_codon:yes stop_codon:yes gene_type:complete
MANYRQQTAGGLQAETACTSCFSTLSLCYSSTENGLCCETPTSVIVYVPSGETFATASNLYATSSLTTLADAGFYSDDSSLCGTSPAGTSYTLQNGTQSDLEYSYTTTSGVSSGALYLGGYESITICAQTGSVSADTGVSISTNGAC